jgi:hypothetical protein
MCPWMKACACQHFILFYFIMTNYYIFWCFGFLFWKCLSLIVPFLENIYLEIIFSCLCLWMWSWLLQVFHETSINPWFLFIFFGEKKLSGIGKRTCHLNDANGVSFSYRPYTHQIWLSTSTRYYNFSPLSIHFLLISPHFALGLIPNISMKLLQLLS